MGNICFASVQQSPDDVEQEPLANKQSKQLNITTTSTTVSTTVSTTSSSSGSSVEYDFVPQDNIISNINKKYKILKTLGHGASCRVSRVENIKDKKQYAMKEMNKNDKYNPMLFKKECKILKLLNHTNILKYYDAYIDKNNFYIITELCQGGELIDHIRKIDHFSEAQAAEAMHKILEIVNYVHENNIVHRDLKLENIVYDKPESSDGKNNDRQLILIDFGDAALIPKEKLNQTYKDFAGSPLYLAPEAIKNDKTGKDLFKCDMWSIGVISYLLVTGQPPFNGNDFLDIIENAKTNALKFPSHVNLSKSCQHFIQQLLQIDPEKRMNCKEALKHEWLLVEAKKYTRPLGQEYLKNLTNFHNACKLKRLIVNTLIAEMNDDDKKELIKMFEIIDEDGNGEIEENELIKYLRFYSDLTLEQATKGAKELIASMDIDGDGTVNLNEFINAKTASKFQDNDHIIQEFKKLDIDGNGHITIDEIIVKFGSQVNTEELKKVLQEVDQDGDGTIDMDEFTKAMKAV